MNVTSLAGRIRRSVFTRAALRSTLRKPSARLKVETLEAREVPAVLPTPVIAETAKFDLGAGFAPFTASDPLNPNRQVTVYSTGTSIVGQYTTNNGNSYGQFTVAAAGLTGPTATGRDPTISPLNNDQPFARVNTPTVTFDRFGYIYVAYTVSNNTHANSGQVVVRKFDFTGGVPVATPVYTRVIDNWAAAGTNDGVKYTPYIAVDNSQTFFQDPAVTGAGGLQSNPFVANQVNTDTTVVYLAYAQEQRLPNNLGGGLVSSIKMVSSGDGGNTWSSPQFVNDNGVAVGQNNSRPTIVFTQGRAGVAGSGGRMVALFNNGGGIVSDESTPGRSATVVAQGETGPIFDRPGSGPTFAITDFANTITLADIPTGFTTVDDLDLTVYIRHANVGDLQIDLIAPDGVTFVRLVRHSVTDAGVATNVGLSGNSMGVINTDELVGTTFDQSAPRNIFNDGAAAPFLGRFRPETGSLNIFNTWTATGAATNDIVGTWTLRIRDNRAGNFPDPPNRPAVLGWNLTISSGVNTTGFGQDRGTGVATVASTADPINSPRAAYSVVVDNTLGAFSPYQNRIYLAYTSPNNGQDIRITYADYYDPPDSINVGITAPRYYWAASTQVNNDVTPGGTRLDNFSEGNKAQFNPTLSIDPLTGTLGIAYYDNRYDPANARALTAFTTAITAPEYQTGSTDSTAPQPITSFEFAEPLFVNHKEQAYDQVLNRIVDLEHIPTNLALASGAAGTVTQLFGESMGLAMFNGRVNLIWTGNLNGGTANELRSQTFSIARGPRVIRGDMGPIAQTITDPGSGRTYNATLNVAGDGRRIFDGFVVEFDRPVDPTSFSAADIEIRFRTPYESPNSAGTLIPVTLVEALDDLSVPNPGPFAPQGARRFLIHVAPQTATGTYSYAIGPEVFDRIRRGTMATTTVTTGGPFAGTTGGIPGQGTANFTANVPNFSPGNVAVNATVAVNLSHTNLSQLRLTLVSPDGRRVTLVDQFSTSRNGYNLTFDDAAPANIRNAPTGGGGPLTGTWQPVDLLRGLAGATLAGAWTLEVTDLVTGTSGTVSSWSLTLTAGTFTPNLTVAGNGMDQNANGTGRQINGAGVVSGPNQVSDRFAAPNPQNGVPFVLPYTSDSLPIVLPGAHVVRTLAENQATTPVVNDNLVKDKTVSYIDIEFDRKMVSTTFTAVDVLQVVGPLGPISGTSAQPIRVSPITMLGGTAMTSGQLPSTKFFRVYFPTQTMNGTYRVQLSSDIRDSDNNGLDTNLNAGVEQLRGATSGGITTTVIVRDPNPSGIAVNIPANQSVTYNLPAVTEAFLVQTLSATMSVIGNVRGNLSATLIAPDGTAVQLFNNFGRDSGTNGGLANVTFSDSATTPNQVAAPPASGLTVTPNQPLATFIGRGSSGVWQLVLSNRSLTETFQLTKFEIGLGRVATGPGVGEPVADQAAVGFRIFNLDPTNPQSRNTWTPVGPTEVVTKNSSGVVTNKTTAGRVGAIAVDPSDRSGNTVYVSGATGGIWKTTNFMTLDAAGPTWIPLTDFGPTRAINIGSLAVYNLTGDPKDTVIIAGTGERSSGALSGSPDYTSNGIGFLLSTDAGNSWRVLDSVVNNADGPDLDLLPGDGAPLPLNDVLRDHRFVGSIVEKIVVDPNRNPVTGVASPILYAAVSRGAAFAAQQAEGLWRSTNLGGTWERVNVPIADFTDVVIAPASADPASGQAMNIFAASPGNGVYVSQNGGTNFANVSTNQNGKPLLGSPTVLAPTGFPTGAAGGRILLATPASTDNNLANGFLKGWIYAVVAGSGANDGLYMSKDAGLNWTKVRLATNSISGFGSPTNNESLDGFHVDVDVAAGFGTISLALVIDPTDPNVVFLGSDTMIRVDVTKVADPHNLTVYSHSNPDGGTTRPNSTGPTQISIREGVIGYDNPGLFGSDSIFRSRRNPSTGQYDDALDGDLTEFPARRVWNYLNLFRNPDEPFPGATNANLSLANIANFQNNGWDASWEYSRTHRSATNPTNTLTESRFDAVTINRMLSFVDPLTGKVRILYGDDQGIHTFVPEANSSLNNGIGFAGAIDGSRNGNIQLAQFHVAGVQPSILAADVAQALFYGAARYDEDPARSTNNILTTGDLQWNADGRNDSPFGDQIRWVQTDATGSGTVYMTRSTGGTTFFQILYPGATVPVVRTTPGLYQFGDGWGGATKFVVNPIDPRGIAIGNPSGRIYLTTNQGIEGGAGGHEWLAIAQPGQLDGSFPEALAFGAPQSRASGTPLNQVLYAGTTAGNVFVTFDGGGTWVPLNTGARAGVLDGSRIEKIVTDPGRGSRSVFVVTQNGVYYMEDSSAAAAGTPAGTWQNFTGNLYAITGRAFPNNANKAGNADWETPILGQTIPGTADPAQFFALNLNTIEVDWRFKYFSTPTNPRIYVGGESGVFRSTDMGQTWTRFPDTAIDGAPFPGGGLPVVNVTDLRLSTGKVDPGTGLPVKDASGRDVSASPDLLVASTFGRGLWAIRVPATASSGPRVVSQSINNPVVGTVSSIDITFDAAINQDTFDKSDIVQIVLPNRGLGGPIVITDRATLDAMIALVEDVTQPDAFGGNLRNVWRIHFTTPLAGDGAYQIHIGPNITDWAGREMDQNQNRVNGQAVADRYIATFVIANNDLADFVYDAYAELLTPVAPLPTPANPNPAVPPVRVPTTAEYQASTITAMENARFVALGNVIRELLATWNNNEARQRLVERLFNNGAAAGEIGHLLPGYSLTTAERDAYVLDLVRGRTTPELMVIDIIAGNAVKRLTDPTRKGFGDEYFSVKSGGNIQTFIDNVYADLFQGTVLFSWLPQNVQAAQLKQAQTPAGRLTLVRNLVNGNVTYLSGPGGGGTGTTRVTTSYREYLVKLAYEKYMGRTPTAAEIKDGRSLIARPRSGAANYLQGSEWLYWRVLTSKQYFGSKTQSPLDINQDTGLPLPDAGRSTNRAWVDGVIDDRFFRTVDNDGDGLPSDQAERDVFARKVLDGFAKQRLAFVRTLTSTRTYQDAFRSAEITRLYQLILNRDPGNPTTTVVELEAALKRMAGGWTFQRVSADLLASEEFYPLPVVGQNVLEENKAWALKVYQTMLPNGVWTVNDPKVIALATLAGTTRTTVGLRTNAVIAFLTGVSTRVGAVNGTDYREQQVRDAYARLLTAPGAPTRTPTPEELAQFETFLRRNRWEFMVTELMTYSGVNILDPRTRRVVTEGNRQEYWEIAR